MRFGVKIYLNKSDKLYVPFNYRRHILSLIKEAILAENSAIYNLYYDNRLKNLQKPFTFSVFLHVAENQREKGKIVLSSNIINLFFSSFSYEFLITVYNGLHKLKGKKLNFLNNNIEIRDFFYIKQKKISNNTVTFKTLSPILVRHIENKKGKGFLKANHPDFKENLFYNVKSLSRNFLNYELKREEFKIISMKFESKKVSLYGNEIANKGIITIKSPVKILQMLYDAGIGAKRSQGFGMLEVVKQGN